MLWWFSAMAGAPVSGCLPTWRYLQQIPCPQRKRTRQVCLPGAFVMQV
jgi:hypothetical protein